MLPLALLVLAAGGCAATSIISKGSDYSLTSDGKVYSLTRNGSVKFNSLREAKRVLENTSCETLEYTLKPLSKLGENFSFLEEYYAEGSECGIRGYLYSMRLRTVNLSTGKDVSAAQLWDNALLNKLLLNDPYLRKIGNSQITGSQPRGLSGFEAWNLNHCDQLIDEKVKTQFYIYSFNERQTSLRFALPYACPGPSDIRHFPTQLGILLSVKYNPQTDFDYKSIEKRVGDGLTVTLNRK